MVVPILSVCGPHSEYFGGGNHMKDGVSVWLSDCVSLGEYLGHTTPYGFNSIALVRILPPLLTHCMTSSKLLNFSVPLFPQKWSSS